MCGKMRTVFIDRWKLDRETSNGELRVCLYGQENHALSGNMLALVNDMFDHIVKLEDKVECLEAEILDLDNEDHDYRAWMD